MQRFQVVVFSGLMVCVLGNCKTGHASECMFVHLRTPRAHAYTTQGGGSRGKEKKNGGHSCRGFAGVTYTRARTQSVMSVLIIIVGSNAAIILSKNNNQDGHLRTLAASLIIHQ
jgi:hypothetical protein